MGYEKKEMCEEDETRNEKFFYNYFFYYFNIYILFNIL